MWLSVSSVCSRRPARDRVARPLGRGEARKTQVAEQWLVQTHEVLATSAASGLEHRRRWVTAAADGDNYCLSREVETGVSRAHPRS
jgi:hypothetical protein